MEIEFSKLAGPLKTIVITKRGYEKALGWIRPNEEYSLEFGSKSYILHIYGKPLFVIKGAKTNYKVFATLPEAKRMAKELLVKKEVLTEKEEALLLKIQKECSFLSNNEKSKAEIVAKRFAEERRNLK